MSVVSRATLELFSGPEFLTGLRLGVYGLLVGAVVGAAWRRLRRGPAPLGGILVAGAVLVGMPVARAVPIELWVGVGLLAIGGSLLPHLPARVVTGPLVVLPGAFLVAYGGALPGEPWIPRFVVGAIVVCAPLVASFDRRHRDRGLAVPLLAISVVGVFFTVPDTREAVFLLGVVLPVAVVGWPVPLASLGSGGSAASVGVILWVIAVGGYGRTGSIIGGAAAFALLVAEPIGRLLAGRRQTILDELGTVSAGLFQLGIVFIASRVAGLRQDPLEAALIAGPLLLGAGAVLGLALPRERLGSGGALRGPGVADQLPDHPSSPGPGQAGQEHPPGSS